MDKKNALPKGKRFRLTDKSHIVYFGTESFARYFFS